MKQKNKSKKIFTDSERQKTLTKRKLLVHTRLYLDEGNKYVVITIEYNYI